MVEGKQNVRHRHKEILTRVRLTEFNEASIYPSIHYCDNCVTVRLSRQPASSDTVSGGISVHGFPEDRDHLGFRYRLLPGEACPNFTINTYGACHSHPVPRPLLLHSSSVESQNAMSSLAITAFSFLLGPVVMGWMFLVLRIVVWVVQVFNRPDDLEAVPGQPKSPARGTDDTATMAVSREEDSAGCTAGTLLSADSGDKGAYEVLDDTGVWDSAMKNSLWEEFYGGMGEDEEFDNVSNYSPR